jgi:carbamoyl-phosphate synthase (ammonia)
MGFKSTMVNYNPETVSTDYDECDRLYFEELSRERVLDIYERDSAEGVIVSVGGQIPNGLAIPLDKAGVKLLGTPADMIDNAEDRMRFSDMIDDIGVQQPRWRELTTADSALDFAATVGYPGEFCYAFLATYRYILVTNKSASSVSFSSRPSILRS